MQKTAITICKRLQISGYEALFAGGAVRDLMMGLESDDIDIATNAKPEEIEHIFEKSYAIGKHFGVILIEENGHHFEIATFRNDSAYGDGRRPDAVFFTDKKEDALRRDFTANALFWDPIGDKLYDFVGGEKDIRDQILRFVGDPEARILEDHLRILRAIRFKNRLGFSYGEKMEDAIQKHAHLVSKVAPERVQAELSKMLAAPTRHHVVEDMERLGVLPVVLPEVSALKNILDGTGDKDVFAHTVSAIKHLPKNADSTLSWAMMLHDIGKAETLVHKEDRNHFPEHEKASEHLARKICNRLKFSRFETDKICWLCKEHIPFYGALQMTFVHRMHFYDHPFFPDLIALCRADALGSDGNESLVDEIEADFHDAHERKLLPQFQPRLLGGKEIMEIAGLSEGSEIGEIKKMLRDKQIAGEISTREEAEAIIRRLKSE
jgi:poly(A) polymerase